MTLQTCLKESVLALPGPVTFVLSLPGLVQTLSGLPQSQQPGFSSLQNVFVQSEPSKAWEVAKNKVFFWVRRQPTLQLISHFFMSANLNSSLTIEKYLSSATINLYSEYVSISLWVMSTVLFPIGKWVVGGSKLWLLQHRRMLSQSSWNPETWEATIQATTVLNMDLYPSLSHSPTPSFGLVTSPLLQPLQRDCNDFQYMGSLGCT